MKTIIAVLAMVVMLSGLPTISLAESTTSIDTGTGNIELYSSDMGRFSAWALVEQKRLLAIQSINKLAVASRDNVQVVLDTEEKIRAWTQYQTTELLGKAVESMAKALSPMSKSLEPTPMPKGAISEGIDSVGGVVEKVGNAPSMVAGVVGHFLSKTANEGIKHAGDQTNVSGEANTVKINKSQNTAAANGEGIATATPEVEVVKPEIVEVEKPFVVEPIVIFAPDSNK